MMTYVIYMTNENGDRVCVKNAAYKSLESAQKACADLNAENPVCEAKAMRVMRSASRTPKILG